MLSVLYIPGIFPYISICLYKELIMSTSSKATQSVATKLEAARAEHAAKTAQTQATAEACKTFESEPDIVHAAAIETMVDAAPGWTRSIIGWIAGIFAGCGTWYYGAMACNLLLAAIGPGFLAFVAYMLCVIVLFMATCIAGWATSSLVTGGAALTTITSTVGGWFMRKAPATLVAA